ncbi:MAG: isoprenyl transferase [Candidatus Zixiibacteriota bacterium]
MVSRIEQIDTSLTERIAEIRARGGVPAHVAIIMDGNGRWANARGLARHAGHVEGVKAVKRVVQTASRLGVDVLTLFTFSVENWKRPRDEVEALMSLLSRSTLEETDELIRNNVRLIVTGRLNEIPLVRRKALSSAIRRTAGNDGLTLNLALSYSGRAEILDAVRAIAREVKDGLLEAGSISEDVFAKRLYTSDLRDPDLLIRTSGERRLSNFLLWQTSYTELYLTDVLWPDFGESELLDAIVDFQGRERRYGVLQSQDTDSD